MSLISCDQNNFSNLKLVQQEQSGDYLITILHPTGKFKVGKNTFIVEFRNASDNQLVELFNIQARALMPMGGQSPMFGGVSVEPLKGSPGRYKVIAEFSMQGTWYLNITSDQGEKAGFTISVLN